MVNIVKNTISSLKLNITQPGESAICVHNCKITVTSKDSVNQQSVIYATKSSPTNVVIGNLQLCLYNYTVEIAVMDWRGSMSEPFVDIGNIVHRGKLRLFLLSQ